MSNFKLFFRLFATLILAEKWLLLKTSKPTHENFLPSKTKKGIVGTEPGRCFLHTKTWISNWQYEIIAWKSFYISPFQNPRSSFNARPLWDGSISCRLRAKSAQNSIPTRSIISYWWSRKNRSNCVQIQFEW